ncbi:MAG: anaerobic glycerol-3-phosphate dehydrogenase subunit A [Deltaproteobacteria bacterium]|nr:anaerobic glycerol-3-phosphate dehydrogenase subunit A [Candidatus Zymogenaceae bacterium]
MELKTEVLVIGGGVTGAGVARDLVMRGIDTILVEKGDLAAGATGRCHGLLHSGGRYVIKDQESAVECIKENVILKRIASRTIEDTGGLFVSLPGDDESYADRFLAACDAAGIQTQVLSLSQALRLEPNLSREAKTVVKVPDGAVDPFALTIDNARDAARRGCRILRHTKLVGIDVEKGRVTGAEVHDRVTDERHHIRTKRIINATGAWAGHVAGLAGANVPLTLSKGSLLIFNRRINNTVINRLRPPGDGDIIVPNEPTSIIGTTSITVSDPENFTVTKKEVDLMMKEAGLVLPPSAEARVIRAYAGIRPLVAAQDADSGRDISRSFSILDHGKQDGVRGFYSIVGGKLTTYRLMAEKMVDVVAEEMGVHIPCSTASEPLFGSEDGEHYRLEDRFTSIETVEEGEEQEGKVEEIVCECELVTKDEVLKVINEMKTSNLNDIRQRTRVGMGSCQGGFCTYRLLGILHELDMVPQYEANEILTSFMEERWRGIRPVLWGDQLREEQLVEGIYLGIFALDKIQPLGKKASKSKK